jgi:hypothetical protein
MCNNKKNQKFIKSCSSVKLSRSLLIWLFFFFSNFTIRAIRKVYPLTRPFAGKLIASRDSTFRSSLHKLAYLNDETRIHVWMIASRQYMHIGNKNERNHRIWRMRQSSSKKKHKMNNFWLGFFNKNGIKTELILSDIRILAMPRFSFTSFS